MSRTVVLKRERDRLRETVRELREGLGLALDKWLDGSLGFYAVGLQNLLARTADSEESP